MAERKRIFAWYARAGLPGRDSRSPHMHSTFANMLVRMKLGMMINAWHGVVAVRTAGLRAWSGVLAVFGEVLMLD